MLLYQPQTIIENDVISSHFPFKMETGVLMNFWNSWNSYRKLKISCNILTIYYLYSGKPFYKIYNNKEKLDDVVEVEETNLIYGSLEKIIELYKIDSLYHFVNNKAELNFKSQEDLIMFKLFS
jgi:hypothetical protein